MRTKMNTWLILLTVLPGILFLGACAKKDVRQPSEIEASSLEDADNEQNRKEAEERELRAEKIKFMYEDVYFKKGQLRSDARGQRTFNPQGRMVAQTSRDQCRHRGSHRRARIERI